jgi:hypothetical protein
LVSCAKELSPGEKTHRPTSWGIFVSLAAIVLGRCGEAHEAATKNKDKTIVTRRIMGAYYEQQ